MNESNRFDQQCRGVEQACKALGDTLKAVTRAERALAKAAAEGDIARIRAASEQLTNLAPALRDAAQSAATAWHWSDADIDQYLEREYEHDLVSAAAAQGVRVDRLDDRLSAYPVLLRIVPAQRAVRLDTKRHTAIRPSVIATRLAALRNAKPKLNPERFLATLFDAYRKIVGDEIGRGTTLIEIYSLLTLHPEMRKQYDKNEFTRDIHLLDASGVTLTKQGYELSLPAATATKSSSGNLTIVGADGSAHTYYGIRFREATR